MEFMSYLSDDNCHIYDGFRGRTKGSYLVVEGGSSKKRLKQEAGQEEDRVKEESRPEGTAYGRQEPADGKGGAAREDELSALDHVSQRLLGKLPASKQTAISGSKFYGSISCCSLPKYV